MHDIALAERIVEDAKKLAKGKITGIKIEVGELASATAAMIAHSMEHVCSWKVEAEDVPAEVKCACGYRGRPKITERMHDFVLFECPECGAVPEIISGGDITVKEVVTQ